MDDLKKLIREVPDYPKPGILFYDLTTLLKDKTGFHLMIDRLCDHYHGHTIDIVAGIDRADAVAETRKRVGASFARAQRDFALRRPATH